MNYCNYSTCYNQAEAGAEYCHKCLGGNHKTKKPFAEGMNEAFQSMEERMEALESDVKRLKRELGLK